MTTRLHILVLIIYFNNVIIINMLIKNMLINMKKMKIIYRQKNPIKKCRVIKIKIMKKKKQQLISVTLL